MARRLDERDGGETPPVYGVWHQRCPACGEHRLSPNVDPGELACDECGYTTTVLRHVASERDGETRDLPAGYSATDWPCKRCRSAHVAERLDDSDPAYDDYHFICLDCGHSWWEESSDY